MNKINKNATYAIINSETKKIIKYMGRLEYYRTLTRAEYNKNKLQTELKIKLEIIKQK